jgi:uncharacterized protein (DUF983 family)
MATRGVMMPPEKPQDEKVKASGVCVQCPKCGRDVVRPTLKSNVGYYCFCNACGTVWHDATPDDLLPQ